MDQAPKVAQPPKEKSLIERLHEKEAGVTMTAGNKLVWAAVDELQNDNDIRLFYHTYEDELLREPGIGHNRSKASQKAKEEITNVLARCDREVAKKWRAALEGIFR